MKSGKATKPYIKIPKNEWYKYQAVKNETNCDLYVLWYERFYANPEGSILKILNNVKMNPQRPEVEDSIANKTLVGGIKYAWN